MAIAVFSNAAAAAPFAQEIRVKIFPHKGLYSTPQMAETDVSAVQLYSRSKCERTSIDSESQKETTTVVPARTQIRIAESTIGNEILKFRCEGPINVFRGKNIGIFFYDGSIEARLVNGQLTLINTISLEDYVKGVLPAEMPNTWHLEALRAQAIAARTYAVQQIAKIRKSKSDRFFDVDDTVLYQAYLGRSWQTERTNQAVENTRGMVLTQEHEPIRAYFSADSGGYTESAKNIWGDRYDVSYTRSKPEPYEPTAKSSWNFQISLKTIETKTIRYFELSPKYEIKDVLVHEKSESGRATKIMLVPRSNEYKTRLVSAEIFRQYMNLPSTFFEIDRTSDKPDTLSFTGKGFGHGVGLNQTGAHILASEHGWAYTRILEFYFDDIRIEQLSAL